MSARGARTGVALFVAGAVLTGCASTAAPTTPHGAVSADSRTLCALDALLWSHEFVPRATDQKCVTILGTVTIGQE